MPIGKAAEVLGRAPRTLSAWRRRGLPIVEERGRVVLVDVDVVAAWVEANGLGRRGRPSAVDVARRVEARRQPAAPGQAGEADDELEGGDVDDLPLDEQLVRAKLRKERALAEKHEITNRKAIGDLLSKDEVQRRWLERVRFVGAGLLALPGKLASRLANRAPREIELELDRAARELLEQFSREWPE